MEEDSCKDKRKDTHKIAETIGQLTKLTGIFIKKAMKIHRLLENILLQYTCGVQRIKSNSH